jgi:hypothetical protein
MNICFPTQAMSPAHLPNRLKRGAAMYTDLHREERRQNWKAWAQDTAALISIAGLGWMLLTWSSVATTLLS